MPFYTPEPVKNDMPDPGSCIVVPVIASYNTAGDCRPLYFQFTCPDGRTESVAIDKVLSVSRNSIFGSVYRCTVTANDRQKQVDLCFHSGPGQWTLRKKSLD